MSWTDALKTGLMATAILNAVVSLAILLDRGLTWRQKVGQAIIVWIVPVFGSLSVGIFMWTQRGSAPATGYPQAPRAPMRNLTAGTHPFPPTRTGS